MSIKNYINNSKIRLNKVNANTISFTENDDRELIYYDGLDINIKENILDINYKRNVGFNTNDIFKIEVEYIITWEIKSGKLKEINDVLNHITKEDRNYLIGQSPFEASLLVSQITKALDFAPLITPPIFIDKNTL